MTAGKMKAFVKMNPGSGEVHYLDWDTPVVARDDVLIQVKAAGICGTDVHVYDWPENIVREYKPKLPLVMGHEFAGVVAEVGAKMKHVKAGDRVTAMPILYCGECYFCRDGRQNICDNRPLLGLGANGAFAQFVSIRSENVYRLDEGISFELGALSELACVGLHAVEKTRLIEGEEVAVVGAGPLGLMLTLLAKHAGAAHVFVTGLEGDRERLERARKAGALPIVVEKEDPRERVLSDTGGLGADVVFETAGSASGVIQALSLARKGARVGILGQGHEISGIETAMLCFREIEMIGTRAYTPKHWQKVSAVLLNAENELRQMITHHLPLRQAEEGIRRMKSREGLKIILLPWEGA